MGMSLEMVERARVEGEDTLIMALTYRCNSRCRFCIIETEIQERLDETDLGVFEEIFAFNGPRRQWKRLTLSGAEVTLHPDLERLAREATTRGGFEVVRIQTNARRLKDPEYTRALYDAGIREYFVSIHAHTPELDARITRSRRSFHEMRAGLASLRSVGARVLSNTVVSVDNASALPDIARFLIGEGIRESQLWSFLEIGEAGQGDQLVSLEQAMPGVLRALAMFEAVGTQAVVKWFPRCLLGRYASLLDNHQPQMLIRDEFQSRLSDGFVFGCAHESSCRWFGRGCDGLHESYTRAFGDEAGRLRPEQR